MPNAGTSQHPRPPAWGGHLYVLEKYSHCPLSWVLFHTPLTGAFWVLCSLPCSAMQLEVLPQALEWAQPHLFRGAPRVPSELNRQNPSMVQTSSLARDSPTTMEDLPSCASQRRGCLSDEILGAPCPDTLPQAVTHTPHNLTTKQQIS